MVKKNFPFFFRKKNFLICCCYFCSKIVHDNCNKISLEFSFSFYFFTRISFLEGIFIHCWCYCCTIYLGCTLGVSCFNSILYFIYIVCMYVIKRLLVPTFFLLYAYGFLENIYDFWELN